MKHTINTLAILLGAFFGLNTPAQAIELYELDQLALEIALESPQALNAINWKVGDTMNYNVNLGAFGNGTSVKKVTKEEGDAIWVRQEIKLSIHQEVIEMLMRRADGKILKMIRNGQEQAVPDQQLEIISSEQATVTVPAGTFETVHITAKSKDVEKLEVWMNPTATCMDGSVKMIVKTSMVTVKMELTSFVRTP